MGFDWQTLILGIVQGVTEFLPVSSSGHLALLQTFFDFGGDNLLAFDLLLHCATLLAVLIFFRNDIVELLVDWFGGLVRAEKRSSEGWRMGWAILAGTLVTAVIGLPLKGVVEKAMESRICVGAGLLVTAGLLCMVPLLPERQRSITLRIALFVGFVQGLAVLPGISRSGSTIVAGLFLGLAVSEAFRFSFLMSIPAILGASFLEFLKVLRGPFVLPPGWLPAAAVAFVLGWIALATLRRLVLSGRWAYFGIYCFFLGLFAILSEVMVMF